MTTGMLEDGYQTGKVTLSPETLTVEGPESLIGQISSVGIRFNIDGAVADVSGTATPEYFDANGNVLSDLGDSVKTVGGDVSYTMQILKVKEVPLDFDVSGEVADGYRYTGPKTDIKSVSVAGLKTDLASVSTITIQGPSLNVQGATKDVECEIDLDDYLPSGLTIVGLDSTTINVTLQVEKLTEKTFTVKPENVTLNGKNSSYSYTVEDTKMEVKVQGLEEDLSSLSASKMNIRVDVSGMGLGEHTATAQLQLGDAYKMLSAPAVTVRVSEHGSSSAQTTESTESNRGDTDSQSSSNRESGASSAKENVDALFLEYDDARSGGFAPLAKVSPDKKVVLGLITTKTPELEDKEVVIKRIHEAAKYIPLDRLYLSPQCGFASCEIGNKLTEEEQWAKLKLVKEIAEEVWGE